MAVLWDSPEPRETQFNRDFDRMVLEWIKEVERDI